MTHTFHKLTKVFLIAGGLGLVILLVPPALEQGFSQVELVEMRTRNSKTFMNPDGTFTWGGSLGDIHYMDKMGDWDEISQKD